MNSRASKRRNNKGDHYYYNTVLTTKPTSTRRKIKRKRNENRKSSVAKMWMSDHSIHTTGIIKLHYEIRDYANYISLTEEDIQQRHEVIAIIESLIKDNNFDWSIKVFGSFYQGLSTIYSDLDLVIINNYPEKEELNLDMLIQIEEMLKQSHKFKRTCSVFARVPIVKTTHKSSMIKVDISVNRNNGVQAAEIIKRVLVLEPILKYSIILLKEILRQSNLNDASMGGMSSFLLFSIIFFYFQRCINRDTIDFDKETTSSDWVSFDSIEENRLNNLGTFLLGFLKYYSSEFNESKYAITLNTGGMVIEKNLKINGTIENNLLYVENFQSEHNDLGKLCYSYQKIKELFKKCLSSLYKSKGNTYSYLEDLGL